jgi:tRNA (Thr-GGU) A37 N-methylase
VPEPEPTLRPIGRIASALTSLADAPMQGFEGAPDAWLEVDARFADALRGIAPCCRHTRAPIRATR